jgi:hypothetical protein
MPEAMQEGLEPGPEQEFLANCLEHLGERNFRLALIESVICLEIVLSGFLRTYLQHEKRLSKSRIENFLSSTFGLTSRVSGVLDLTLPKELVAKIDADLVLKAVGWRNAVMHKTGRLPAHLDEKTLRKHVAAVLTLVRYLANRRDEIAAEPELRAVGETIAKEFGGSDPTMRQFSRHVVWVDYFYFSKTDLPLETDMERIVARTGQLLADRDPRFELHQHLYARFLTYLDGPQWGWTAGRLYRYVTRTTDGL